MCVVSCRLLDLADDLAGLAEGLDHLLALLSSADGEVTLFEEVIQGVAAVHILQKLLLHLVLGKSIAC